jgi:hypothetical protein
MISALKILNINLKEVFSVTILEALRQVTTSIMSWVNEHKVSKEEVDTIELITTDDIDEICGQNIHMSNEVKF